MGKNVLRISYYECTSADEVFQYITEHAPRTVIFDVEPLVAYWNTDTVTLDKGLSYFVARTADIPSVQAIGFATNSHRRPSTLPASSNVYVLYRADVLKPFRV